MMILHAGFVNDPAAADEPYGEKPRKDEPEIRRLEGYGAVQSDLERGYLETQPPKWIPRDMNNYSQRTLDDLDIEADDEPTFRRTLF